MEKLKLILQQSEKKMPEVEKSVILTEADFSFRGQLRKAFDWLRTDHGPRMDDEETFTSTSPGWRWGLRQGRGLRRLWSRLRLCQGMLRANTKNPSNGARTLNFSSSYHEAI